MKTGNPGHRDGNGRPGTSKEKTKHARRLNQNDALLSIRNAECLIELSPSTLHCILRGCLILFLYKLPNLQTLIESDIERCLKF